MNLLLPALVMIYCKILPDRRSGQKIGSSVLVATWSLGPRPNRPEATFWGTKRRRVECLGPFG